jgi:hypothetical protein
VTAPVITGPSSATPTFGWSGSSIALTPALLGLSAFDDVDGSVAVTISPATAVVGDQLVTASATDAAGNTASRSFTVRVTDATTPRCRSHRESHDRDDARDHSTERGRGSDPDSDDDDHSRGRGTSGDGKRSGT